MATPLSSKFQSDKPVAKAERAAIYCRVSTKRQQDRDLSIPAQVQAIRAFAEVRGYSVVAEFLDAQSGTKTNRPQFQALLAASRRQPRPFDHVICYAVDRFGRSVYDSAIKHELRLSGLTVQYVHGPDTRAEGGLLMERIQEVIAQELIEKLRREVPRGQRQTVLKNRQHGTGIATAPFGYSVKCVLEGKFLRKYLEPNPDTAPFLCEMFRRYAAGTSIRAIAHWLNSVVPTQAVLNNRRPRGITHGQWLQGTVLRILRNPVYLGKIIYGRRNVRSNASNKRVEIKMPPDTWTVNDNGHPALVETDLFNKVQSRLATKVKFRPRPDREPNILGGLGRCAACGGSVTMEHNGKRGRAYFYCRTYRRHGLGTLRCRRIVRRETVENEIIRNLNAILLPSTSNLKLYYFDRESNTPDLATANGPDARALEKAVAHYNSHALSGPDPAGLAINRLIQNLEKKRDNILDAISDGSPPSSLIQRLRDLEERIEKHTRQRDELLSQIRTRFVPLDPKKIIEDARSLTEALTNNDNAGLRSLLPLLVSDIRIDFSFDERSAQKKAQLTNSPVDAFGLLVIRTLYDPTNIEAAGYDALSSLALIAVDQQVSTG